MTYRFTSLRVEELAQRVLPSVSTLTPGLAPGALLTTVVHTSPVQHDNDSGSHALAGTGSGTYQTLELIQTKYPKPVDSGHARPEYVIVVPRGTDFTFQGTADLDALGQVTVTGSVANVGTIASGHASGTLTFTNANGSVTIALADEPSSISTLPQSFDYHVVSSTGAYQNLHDHGELQLTLGSTADTPQTFTLTIP